MWLEDQCEDPLEDAQTLATLEAFDGQPSTPIIVAMVFVRAAVHMTVGVGMVLAGKDPHATIDQINWVLPLPVSGPNPDMVAYHGGMLKEETYG